MQAIYLITTGAREAAFRNIKTIAECLADELINAAKGSSNRYARRVTLSMQHTLPTGCSGSRGTLVIMSWCLSYCAPVQLLARVPLSTAAMRWLHALCMQYAACFARP